MIHETEPDGVGGLASIATLFLANRECPWRCLMCDLWRNTLDETVPPGAIAAQIRSGLDKLPPARWIKLYNAGSFFDPRAIPPDEYEEIARLLDPFDRVIVECHPALVGSRVDRFQELLNGRLEIAVGLETANPRVLAILNKGMTTDDFARAADYLHAREIDLRTFILLRPPFMTEEAGVEWAHRSLDFAWNCGARVCALIPTRGGNGALEKLAAEGFFHPPKLTSIESTVEYGLNLRRSLVFADLWDLEQFADCNDCFPRRRDRLAEMNLSQTVLPPIDCQRCGHSAA